MYVGTSISSEDRCKKGNHDPTPEPNDHLENDVKMFQHINRDREN